MEWKPLVDDVTFLVSFNLKKYIYTKKISVNTLKKLLFFFVLSFKHFILAPLELARIEAFTSQFLNIKVHNNLQTVYNRKLLLKHLKKILG